MKRLVLLLFLAAPLAAQGALKISCHDVDESRCEQLIAKVQPELSKFPVESWHWVILGADSWRRVTKNTRGFERANSAASIVEARRTYVRADWLSRAGFREMVSVIAHEYGHVNCRTNAESKADACANRLLLALDYNWDVRKHLAAIH